MQRNIQTILEAYVGCALWCEDINGTIYHVLPSNKETARQEIETFLNQAKDLLTDDWTDEQIGHDFWLTTNGHGSGFWDRGLPNGNELTKICAKFRGKNVSKLKTGEIEIH